MVLQNLSWPPGGHASEITHCSPQWPHVGLSGRRCRSLTSFHSCCNAIFLSSPTLSTDSYKSPMTSEHVGPDPGWPLLSNTVAAPWLAAVWLFDRQAPLFPGGLRGGLPWCTRTGTRGRATVKMCHLKGREQKGGWWASDRVRGRGWKWLQWAAQVTSVEWSPSTWFVLQKVFHHVATHFKI